MRAVATARREYDSAIRVNRTVPRKNMQNDTDNPTVDLAVYVLWEREMQHACWVQNLKLAEASLVSIQMQAAVKAAARIYAQAHVYEPPVPNGYSARLVSRSEEAIEWECICQNACYVENLKLNQITKSRREAQATVEIETQQKHAARHRKSRNLRSALIAT